MPDPERDLRAVAIAEAERIGPFEDDLSKIDSFVLGAAWGAQRGGANQTRIKELESHIEWVLADCDPESKKRVYDHLREVLGWTNNAPDAEPAMGSQEKR